MIAHTVPLPYDGPPVLGLGAFLKSTVTLVANGQALVSDGVGNLDTRKAIEAFEGAIESLLRQAAPTTVAHDLHPDFYSSRRAQNFNAEAIPVQHHHAHVAAVMAEHGERGPVLGLALDGYGLGTDGQSWGGELLRVDRRGFERRGHLRPLYLPGGDKAAREPWRMAASALHALGRGEEITQRFSAIPGAAMLQSMLERGTGHRTTTSAGRLFDAACGLLGLKPVTAFEGEAPMALEAMVGKPKVMDGAWSLEDGVLDLLPLLSALTDMDASEGADLFHGTLEAALAHWVGEAAEATGIPTVVLSGGCFLNRVLRAGLAATLAGKGLRVLLPEALSPGDPAVSLGQAWAVAIMREV